MKVQATFARHRPLFCTRGCRRGRVFHPACWSFTIVAGCFPKRGEAPGRVRRYSSGCHRHPSILQKTEESMRDSVVIPASVSLHLPVLSLAVTQPDVHLHSDNSDSVTMNVSMFKHRAAFVHTRTHARAHSQQGDGER